jgi:uncharacterized protein (UPF0335 family)
MSTQKEYIAELVRHYTAEDSLKEEIKEVKDSIKEAGFDAAILSAVAKAIVQNKVDDLSTKSEDILAAIKLARS